MASAKVLYSIAVVVLGFVCFVLGAVAVGLPTWGKFSSYPPDFPLFTQSFFELPSHDQGYFGPWRVCKLLLYNKERCGTDVSKFRPIAAVYLAGVVATIGVAVLGVYCVLSVLQLAMITSRERVGIGYPHLVLLKLALALLAALLSIVGAGLFAAQGNDRGFYLTRGEGFYVQIACIVLNCALFVMSVYDALYSRRAGGDPTVASPATTDDTRAGTTINNPGFKEGRGVSVTDASGKPYSSNGHGSVASVNTTATTVTGLSESSTGSRATPLRSSLKKPRPPPVDGAPPGLGIHNPGYSGHSPTFNRNGSQKKVRIQTHSTEV